MKTFDSLPGDIHSICRHSWFSLLLCAVVLTLPVSALAAGKAPPPDGTQYVSKEKLIGLLSKETGLPSDELRSIMKPATFVPAIIKKMTTPWEARPYAQYRPLFVKKRMHNKGRAYLKKHDSLFASIEKKYQVEAAVITAILGIETRFGAAHGKNPILDSLYTLSTGYPRRAKFFRAQLGAIIKISRQDKFKLKELKGSYAGAFGSIQFIPTSFRDYAVDEDGDSIRDVFESYPDIFGSVANYFQKHGWQYGRPSAHWLPVDAKLTAKWRKRADGKLKHWVTLADLRQSMPDVFSHISAPWRDDDKVSIIEMETKQGRQLALVHYNFYVIMRYNPSFNYAMAVTEIASMLERHTFAVD
jgi:membrane-bound lytic murein transglycosylase B